MLFIPRQRIVKLGSLSFFFLFGFATKGYDNKNVDNTLGFFLNFAEKAPKAWML